MAGAMTRSELVEAMQLAYCRYDDDKCFCAPGVLMDLCEYKSERIKAALAES